MKTSRHTQKLMRTTAAVAALLLFFLFLLPSAEAAVYRRGSRGETVKQIQQRLKNWGYYKGEVDGIFGPKTEEAVKLFQKKNKLTVDGIVGPKTLEALGLPAGSSSGSGQGSSSYQKDIDLLARMIAAEGRGEPYLGQVAIGAVIMNRIKSPSFPNPLSGVLFQKGAFSAVDDGQFQSTDVPDSCRRAAIEAYNGADPTNGCLYYYAPAKTTNKWMLSKPVYLKIGNHNFCK